MFTYNGLETELATRLTDFITANDVQQSIARAIPQNDKEMQEVIDLTAINDVILIKYCESKYGTSETINHVAQPETMTVAFIIIGNRPSSVNTLKQVIDLNCLGYMPQYCFTRLVAKDYAPVDWQNLGVLNTYYMTCERMIYQQNDEEQILGNQFKKLFVNQTLEIPQ